MARAMIGREMEILLVEDNLMDARLTIGMLKQGKFRHRVTLVRDGTEALVFLRREGMFARAPRPDLILLDLEMPKLDGRAVLSELKSDFDLKDIPVVILTSSEAEEDRQIGRLLHVEDYITKPVMVESFIAMIQRLKHLWRRDLVLPMLD